jgi:hypothetical protein
MPTPHRTAAALLAGARIAYAAGLVAAPARLTGTWLGSPSTQPATQIAVRGLGVRELGLSAGALAAALRGAPVRPWLTALVAGDLTDIAASALGRNGIPSGSLPKVGVVAGVTAALTVATAVAVDA